jgi:hypothetical protein
MGMVVFRAGARTKNVRQRAAQGMRLQWDFKRRKGVAEEVKEGIA